MRNPSIFQGPQENERSISFKVWREMGGQTEVFYYNIKIMLYHQPNSFFQGGNPYAVHSVGNSPDFMPLDNLISCDILHSLHMHIVLSSYIFEGEETNEEEMNICFSYSTPGEIASGLKRIWDSKVTVTSANSQKICSYVMICFICVCRKNGRSLSSSTTALFLMIKKLALRTNDVFQLKTGCSLLFSGM